MASTQPIATRDVASLPVLASALPALATLDQRTLVEDFLAGRSENTRRAYSQDLHTFAAWLGVESLDQSAEILLGRGNAHANKIVLAYRNHLRDEGRAPATINRRVTALRTMAKLGRLTGRYDVVLDVGGVRREPVRDCRGPGLDGLRALVAAAERRKDSPRKRRDRAVLRLLTDLGLRRGEISSLDLEHVDGNRICVLGKGRTARIALTLSTAAQDALRAWLDVRPESETSALFVGLSVRARGLRLSGKAIRGVTGRLAREAGLGDVRPHQLRHGAITSVLGLNGGNVRTAQDVLSPRRPEHVAGLRRQPRRPRWPARRAAVTGDRRGAVGSCRRATVRVAPAPGATPRPALPGGFLDRDGDSS